jgi:hypothetical protein
MVVSRFTENYQSYREDALSNLRTQYIDGESSIPKWVCLKVGYAPKKDKMTKNMTILIIGFGGRKSPEPNFSWSIQQVGIGHTSLQTCGPFSFLGHHESGTN